MLITYKPFAALRSNPKRFLREGLSPSKSIALSLAETAIHDGSVDVRITVNHDHSAMWFDKNWILAHYHCEKYDAFMLSPLAGRANTFRGEVLLSAFCNFYAVCEQGRIQFVFGTARNPDVVVQAASGTARSGFSVVYEVAEAWASV